MTREEALRCGIGDQCQDCRDKVRGEGLRVWAMDRAGELAHRSDLENHEWECPLGKPWGFIQKARQYEIIAGRFRVLP